VRAAGQEAAEWAAGGQGGLPGEARGWLQQVLLAGGEGLDAPAGVQLFGRGGGAREALQSGLHVALGAKSYAEGVRHSILAGGDTTSRHWPPLPVPAPCRMQFRALSRAPRLPGMQHVLMQRALL
jgi:hypothetical protein